MLLSSKADPSLVDPGLTAQLECLLDEVVIGKQEMIGAIDAVCDVAQRIIGRLQERAVAGGPPLPGAVTADGSKQRPPTQALKRFADSIARKNGVKPPPGYATSGSICRAVLDRHAPKNAGPEVPGTSHTRPQRPAQMLSAGRPLQENGISGLGETGASSSDAATLLDPDQVRKRAKHRHKGVNAPMKAIAPRTAARGNRPRKLAANVAATMTASTPAGENSGTDTPLRIPYGNKDTALKLGARYRTGQWYAPPGVDLAAFGERGWL